MQKNAKRNRRFSSEEIANFCDQTAMLLNSGVPIHEGIHILYTEIEDKKTKSVLAVIDEEVNSGQSLYRALEKADIFPEYMLHMVKVGETTGKLEEVMKALSAYYERDSRTKAGIKSAITYPLILFTMMAAILVVLVWKILPLFEDMLAQLNAEVADSTRNVMNAGLFAGKMIAISTCVILAITVILLVWYRTAPGENFIRKIAAGLGLTRKTYELLATGKFIASMSLVINSGVDIKEALILEIDSCSNPNVRKRLEKCLELYNKGESYDSALKTSEILTGVESRLINVAFKTGNADVAFEKLSTQYNERINKSLSRTSGIIETTLVVTLSVMIGAVLIAVMLPMVSMISSIGA